ncbi:MAG: Gfo/Idh/MocA family oxidoreductase, partial [Flavobacteriaceae bacterium]
MIKLAIVGLGRIGKVHLKNCIFSLPEVQVVAACSRSEQSLNFAKNLGVKALYTSIDDLFKEVDFDAIIIASPTAFHFEHLQKAIAHKKHIFCEKPIDLSLANTQLLIKQLEKQPVKFMLGFNRRFDPSILKIKNEISKGKQG